MIDWQLQTLMQANGLKNSTVLYEAMRQTLGVDISRQALDKLLKHQPKQLKLETAEYLCSYFQVGLSELLTITTQPRAKRVETLIKPYVSKAPPVIFSDPEAFLR